MSANSRWIRFAAGSGGTNQIAIAAKTVVDASPFYRGLLLGGVLQSETDRLFLERKKN